MFVFCCHFCIFKSRDGKTYMLYESVLIAIWVYW